METAINKAIQQEDESKQEPFIALQNDLVVVAVEDEGATQVDLNEIVAGFDGCTAAEMSMGIVLGVVIEDAPETRDPDQQIKIQVYRQLAGDPNKRWIPGYEKSNRRWTSSLPRASIALGNTTLTATNTIRFADKKILDEVPWFPYSLAGSKLLSNSSKREVYAAERRTKARREAAL